MEYPVTTQSQLLRSDFCRVCGGGARVALISHGLTYLECKRCSLLYLNPVPSMKWYSESYSSSAYWRSRNRPIESHFLRGEVRAVAFVRAALGSAIPEAPRILEIGGGLGVVGRAVAGVLSGTSHLYELDGALRASATLMGCAVHASWDEVRLAGPFDVIVASHVLEHVVDPVDELERWASVLSHGGVMLIEVPNGMMNLSVEIWHPVLFTRRSLKMALQRVGFDAVCTVHGGPKSKIGGQYLLATARRSRGSFSSVWRGFRWTRWHNMGVKISLLARRRTVRKIDKRLARHLFGEAVTRTGDVLDQYRVTYVAGKTSPQLPIQSDE